MKNALKSIVLISYTIFKCVVCVCKADLLGFTSCSRALNKNSSYLISLKFRPRVSIRGQIS